MKKLISIVLLCAMLISCFAGCGMQKGQIDLGSYAAQANSEQLALTTPTTKPTTGISTWTGGNIPNTNTQVTISEEGELACTLSGADVSWFDPTKTAHTLSDAADLVGFMVLRLVTTNSTFTANYKTYTGRDLNFFAGQTFKLASHVDLNGVEMKVYDSNFIFEGTFDGGNHAIMNFEMKFSTGTKGFFSKIQGDACLKNFSLFDVKGSCSGAGKENVGSVVGNVATVAGKTASVINVYSDADMTVPSSITSTFKKIGGLIGTINGAGTANITDCVYAGTIDADHTTVATGQYSAGICAVINGSADVNFTNCSTTSAASITTSNTYAAGIFSYCSGSGDVVLTDCVNNAPISSTGYAGGIVGFHKTGSLSFDGCVNSANVTSSGNNAGGVLSGAQLSSKIEMIECSVSAGAIVTGKNICGGVAGYITDVADVDIVDCSFAGTLNADRASGGIVGYLDIESGIESPNLVVDNCDVSADAVLNFEITNTNPTVGGIVGRVRSAHFAMEDCDFAGKMTVTFTTPAADLTQRMAAAGLVGCLFDDNSAQAENAVGSITNSTVTGTLRFLDNTDALCTAAIFVGGSTSWLATTHSITYTGLSCTGVTVDTSEVSGDEKGTPMAAVQNGTGPTVIGYQVSAAYDPADPTNAESENKTAYDLRYVAVLNDASTVQGVGFKVTLVYKDGEGNRVEKVTDQIVYATELYKSIKGTTASAIEESYTAASYMGDYLYTLVIKGVDNGYTVAAGTLEVLLTPFTAEDAETLNMGMTADHGKVVVEEAGE